MDKYYCMEYSDHKIYFTNKHIVYIEIFNDIKDDVLLKILNCFEYRLSTYLIVSKTNINSIDILYNMKLQCSNEFLSNVHDNDEWVGFSIGNHKPIKKFENVTI